MRRSSKKQEGMVLIAVLFLATILVLVSASLLYISSIKYSLIIREQGITKSVSISESGTQLAVNKIKSQYKNISLAKLKPDIKFTDVSTETPLRDDTKTTADEKVFSDEHYESNGNYYIFNFKDLTTAETYPVYYRITDRDWTDNGIVSGDTVKKYNVESITKNKKGLWTGISSDVEIERKNLFNYGIFFDDELEINTNKDFTLKGPVHSNKHIFIDSSANLNIDSKLTAAGYIIKGRKDGSVLNGTVKIKNNSDELVNFTSDNDAISTLTPVKIVDKNWKDGAIKTWGGNVQDNNQGVQYKPSISIKLLDRGGYYEKKSSLKIITSMLTVKGKPTKNIQVLGGSGITLYSKDVTSIQNNTIETVRINNMNIDDDTFSITSFRDEREKIKVSNTVIDLEKLQEYTGWPSNNLVYATRTDFVSDAKVPDGFLLKNGSTLKNPMIFVTNNPVYIKGDFNKHDQDEDSSEYGDPNSDTWRPVTVIADAITLLSNNWTGSSFGSAADTEFNLAMIAGTVIQASNKDLAGSLFRFLENWDGKNAKIRGSVIQLWHSQYATGTNTQGSPVYSNPNIDFGFDPSFAKNSFTPDFYDFFPSTTERIEQINWKKIIDAQSNIFQDLKRLNLI